MFAKVGTPEGVFVKSVAERGEPEVEEWELSGWTVRVGAGLAKGLGEAAGDEYDPNGGFTFEDFAYDARFVLRISKMMFHFKGGGGGKGATIDREIMYQGSLEFDTSPPPLL